MPNPILGVPRRITDLPDTVPPLDGSESVPVVQSGTAREATVQQFRGSSGTTAERPTLESGTGVMFGYYDTTLGKPIWWSGSAWKDATGATV